MTAPSFDGLHPADYYGEPMGDGYPMTGFYGYPLADVADEQAERKECDE